jgi:tRNA modification GTPase
MDPKASVAMLLTPPGSAAIAVVRLAGPKVAAFLSAHFSRRAVAGRCVHGDLSDGSNVLDDPVVVLSDDGSYADVNVHGGPWVVQSLLALVSREGFEVIDRASAHGSPLPEVGVTAATELQREILAYLPLATTEMALAELLAQEEAWSRLEQMSPADRRSEAKAMQEDQSLYWLLHPPRVAIAGAPNVGKSTLANQLFAQERSITADMPGTTRDWVGEMANIDGLAVTLVDTPGIRATSDLIESVAIERSDVELRKADLVLLVLDQSAPLEPEQAEVMRLFPEAICIVNKCDRQMAWDDSSIREIRIVATTGEGVDGVRAAIKDRFGIGKRAGKAKWWSQRQRDKLADE